MCTAFSRLQQLNYRWKTQEEVNEIMNEAMKHIEFTMYLYKIQSQQGLYFLHEHPASATSWNTRPVKEVMKLPNVQRINADMCAFGMMQSDEMGEAMIKKPTAFMSNSPCILNRLGKKCEGNHRHIVLFNGRAKRAEVYPDELWKKL